MRYQKAKSSERGSILLEASMAIPLLILICSAILEFGFSFRERAALSESIRVASRIIGTHTPPYVSEIDTPIPPDLVSDANIAITQWLDEHSFNASDYKIEILALTVNVGRELPFVRIEVSRKLPRTFFWNSFSIVPCSTTFSKAPIEGAQFLPSVNDVLPACQGQVL